VGLLGERTGVYRIAPALGEPATARQLEGNIDRPSDARDRVPPRDTFAPPR